jgi:hypothetical protein
VIVFYFASRIPAIDETSVDIKFGIIVGGLCIAARAHLHHEVQDGIDRP